MNFQSTSIRKFNFKNWVLPIAFSGLVGIFSTSCQKATTSDLIPDSCQGLIKLDLPKLVPKLVTHPFVIDSLNHLAGFPLDKMGINFFQPAYLFQRQGSSDLVFVLALNDAKKFSDVILGKFNAQKIEKKDEFSTFWVGHWELIWNENFLVGKKVDPLLGKPDWNPEWAKYFFVEKEKTTEVQLDEKSDIAWFWNIEEELVEGIIPPLELLIKGNGTWEHPKFSLRMQIEEHQYLALLHPFTLESKSKAPIQVVIWPALESILLQIESYGGNPFKTEMNSQILDMIKKMDHPFECLLVENKSEDLLQAIQIKTRYSDEKLAILMENEIRSMLPKSVLSKYTIERRGGEVAFFNQSSKPVFSEYTKTEKPMKNLILGLFQKDGGMETNMKLALREPGKYELTLDATHLERIAGQMFFRQILSIQPEEILGQFLPAANEKNP